MSPPPGVMVIFTVRTPPDWFTIPLHDPVVRGRAIAALVRTRFAWRDDQPHLRERVERMIDEAVGRAAARDATHLCVWTANIDNAPIAASLVISTRTGLDMVGSPRGVALMLADELSPAGSVVEIVELKAGPAVRRQVAGVRRSPGLGGPRRGRPGPGDRRVPEGLNGSAPIPRPKSGPEPRWANFPDSDAAPIASPAPGRRPSPGVGLGAGSDPALGMTTLEYLIPVPNPAARAIVLLSFATPVGSLAGALTFLFDAIASSLSWEPR
ncbi:MAG: hypothetical protein ACQSGP_05070 [Frankia sp.]